MKKILIAIILLPTVILAQNSTGILAGINLATLAGDSTKLPNRDFRYGTRAGMFWNINIRYNTYFQFGFFYSQQGCRYYHNYFDYTKEVNLLNINKIDYIQMPFVWKESFNNIYTKIGFYLEVATNAKSLWYIKNIYKDTIEIYSGQYKSFTNNLRLYDAGIYLGIGFQFPTKSNTDLIVDFSFIHGFFPILENEFYKDYKMRNMVFNASVGILFNKNYKTKKHKRHR